MCRLLQFFVAVTWFALSAMSVPGAEPVRLAIIPGGPALTTVADVLTAGLATNKEVALVERDQLNRVIREQANAANNGSDFIKVGMLLGADGLLVLQNAERNGTNILTSRLIAVKPGVTLVVEMAPWPMANPVEWCQRVEPRLISWLPKLRVVAKDAIPISVLNLRSALRNRESEVLERELTLLLIHRLTKEQDVFVLERQHLHNALFEKELRPEEESPFWTGRYLFDGVLDKNGFDTERITVSARLAPSTGESPTAVEISGPRNDPTALVDALVKKILATLNREQGGNKWNPAREAEQFLDEAKWAFRWSLWSEAQMAVESAWALGLRTPEVAALRIRSYGEEVMRLDPSTGNILVPGLPDATKLRPACRAAEIFATDAKLVITNGSATNQAWFELGVQTLRRSASLLDGFYLAAELRQGNEDAIVDLREATRLVVPMLDAIRPLDGQLSDTEYRRYWKPVVERLEQVKWMQGGVWFDHPEDSLPMFRQMLEGGSHPKGLPRIVAWTWPERKRVPAIIRQFIASLGSATNSLARLEGLYLAALWEPMDTEGRFERREAELLSGLWAERGKLWLDAEAASLIPRSEDLLRDKYRYIFHGCFDHEPWRGFVRNLRTAYLSQVTNWNEGAFRAIFPDDVVNYSSSEAAALAPLFAECKQRLGLTGYKGQLLDFAATRLGRVGGLTNYEPILPAAPKPVEFTQLFPGLTSDETPPWIVSFKPWRLRNEGQAAWAEPKIARLISRGGRLWAMIQYVTEENRFMMNCPTAFVSVNPRTGDCEEIQWPPALGFPETCFEVTDDSIFVSVGDHLQRYRFKGKAWEKITVPIAGGLSITATGDSLFVASRENLLELDPKSHGVRVLVSSRRRPPESELDEQWKGDAHVFAWQGATLGLQLGTNVFSFHHTNRTWSKTSLPAAAARYGMFPYVSNDGVEYFLNNFNRKRLVAVRDQGREVASLLEQPGEFKQAKPPPEPAFASPRWDWPAPFDFDYQCILSSGGGLWAWQPRTIARRFSTPRSAVSFTDQRHATLLRFEAGRRSPLPLGIRFENNGAPVDPFEATQNGYMGWPSGLKPHCLISDQGLIIACGWATPGHWLLDKPELEGRLQRVRDLMAAAETGGGAKK